ncbi:MAG: Fic family protein [Bryobacter sp.]|jgi:Fic family protein|nr:Fic family protein [Bryobacter sp.]
MPEPFAFQPIQDLPRDWKSLSSGELQALRKVLQDLRGDPENFQTIARFEQELQREWAIATGEIEGVYRLDRGTTEILIEKGIQASLIHPSATDRDPEFVAATVLNHKEVLEGIFQFVKGDRQLTTGYIKELHSSLLRTQPHVKLRDLLGRMVEVPTRAGEYKLQPNNPQREDGTAHNYCPPEHVAAEMDRLVAMHAEHQAAGVPAEIGAAWLHHRFTEIHPFVDGNGRVARALASLVLIKDGWFPFVVPSDERSLYIDALEVADRGDLLPLVDYFERRQRQVFISLLNARDRSVPADSIEEAISRGASFLAQRRSADPERRKIVFSIAESAVFEYNRFSNQVAERLRAQARTQTPALWNVSESHSLDPEQLLNHVEAQGLVFDRASAKVTGALRIQAGRPFLIALGLFLVGRTQHGVMVARLFTIDREQVRSLEPQFQFNYRESSQVVTERIRPWLEAAFTRALQQWRETL